MSGLNSLPRSLPEELSIPSRAVADFVKAVEARELELHSFMLLRHGRVAAQGWWRPYRADLPHMLYSLSKSFTSTAIGMAVSEGLLSVDDQVVSFFPNDLPGEPDAHMALMRVRHLLTMTTGHGNDAMSGMSATHPQHLVRGFLHSAVEFEPGAHFSYNNGATYMLSAIVQQVSGQTLFDYLQPRLFQPLGIVGAAWTKCSRGVNMGAFGLSLKTEDIAKFGQLYLQNGVWDGNRILSESWIAEAVSPFLPVKSGSDSDWEQGYGYQFWRCRHRAYRGDGAFGQYCVVMPEQDAVLAITAGVSNLQAVLDCVWEFLLPAIGTAKTDSLSSDEEATQAALRQQLEALVLLPPGTQAGSARADHVQAQYPSGARYEMEENADRVHAIQFEFQADGRCLFTQWDGQGEHRVSVGHEEWVENESGTQIEPYASRIVASGTWQDAGTFIMTWRFVETPYVKTMHCFFVEDAILIKSSLNVSFGPTELPAMKGKMKSSV